MVPVKVMRNMQTAILHSKSRIRPVAASLLVLAALAGCQATRPTPLVIELVAAQTAPGLGSGQGAEVRDGKVYLYGDAETGVIREFNFVTEPHPQLVYTGRELLLTRDGVDLISHPTGITFHPEDPRYGTLIGDTVAGQGMIYFVDWERLLADGNLDHAVLHVVEDDAGVNGTRPEFVYTHRPEPTRATGAGKDDAAHVWPRWYVATSDYGNVDNAVRYYDPQALRSATHTSADGVLAWHVACRPWVQNLHWLPVHDRLALVQNQIAGLRWRLTFVPVPADQLARSAMPADATYAAWQPFDDFLPVDELEGFHMIDDEHAVLFSSSRRLNVWIGRVKSAAWEE
jgi:hypothetical protein